jgi:hypothetical protein
MSEPRRRPTQRRGNARRRPSPSRNFWGAAPTDDDRDDLVIRPVDDPSVMIRSLGPPPLPGGETMAEHYFVAVYEKAAALALALAAASDLLDTGEDEEG